MLHTFLKRPRPQTLGKQTVNNNAENVNPPAKKQKLAKTPSPKKINSMAELKGGAGGGTIFHKWINSMTGRGAVKNEISEEHRFYGLFSESSYQDDPEDFLRNNLDSFDYRRDEELSSDEIDFWVNEERKHTITSVRGTKVASDLTPDLHILLGRGKESTRYKRNKKSFQAIRKKYGEHFSYDVTGHSLGGYIAQGLGTDLRDDVDHVYSFNPGSSPLEAAGNVLKEKTDNSHIHTVWVSGDPISAFGRDYSHNVTVYEPQNGVSNPHSICNITKTCLDEKSE